ncbi:KAP family P-loop NTPase fold protein [Aquirufa nivalisilvae]
MDFREYLNEFKSVNAIYVFIALIFLFSFSSKLDDFLICNILSKNFNSNSVYWPYIFSLIFIICIYRILNNFLNNLLPPLFHIFYILIISISLHVFEINSTLEYITFNFYDHYNLKFVYCFYYTIVSLLLPFKNYIKYPLNIVKREYSLINDNSNHENIDLLIREKFITSIKKHIDSTILENSFSIGIIGKWGSGKTNILIRLKESLLQSKNNIVIELNPWRIKGVPNLIETFFEKLKLHLTEFDSSFYSQIDIYYDKVLSENTPNEYLNYILKILKIQNNKNDKFESVNNLIRKSNKRFIVLIDDIDRLGGIEIIDIFSFIRHTANFTNTFFIIPYDKTYISNVISKTNQFYNEEEYLKKIFQLEIILPDFKKSFYVDEIRKYIVNILDSNTLEYQQINDAITKVANNYDWITIEDNDEICNNNLHDNIFEVLIENIRDLKRFCNSLKIIIDNIDFEAEVSELIVLELIKNCDYNSFCLISSKQILNIKYDYNTQQELEAQFEVNWKNLETSNNKKPLNPYLKNVINKLFDNSKKDKNSRSIIYTRNFYLYFSYHSFEEISLKEYLLLKNSTSKTIISKFNNWLKKNAENELYTIISNENNISNLKFYKSINISILQIADNLDWRWIELVLERILNPVYFNLFSKNEKIRRKYIFSVLNEKRINPYFRAYLLKSICDSDTNFYSESAFKKKTTELFKEYSEYSNINYYYTEKFHLISHNIINNTIIPHKENSSIYQSILIKNPVVFNDFVLNFLRIIDSGNQNGTQYIRVVFNPFVKYIFTNMNKFKELVEELDVTIPNNSLIKELIITNINSSESIYIDDSDKIAKLNHLGIR